MAFGPSKTLAAMVVTSSASLLGLLIALVSPAPAHTDALVFKITVFVVVTVSLVLIMLPFALISARHRVLISLDQNQVIISGRTYPFEEVYRATLVRVVSSFTNKGAVGPRYELVLYALDGKFGKLSIDHRDRTSSERMHYLASAVERMTSLAETIGLGGDGRHIPTTSEPIEVGRREILDTIHDHRY